VFNLKDGKFDENFEAKNINSELIKIFHPRMPG
jgi:hypothetical protein